MKLAILSDIHANLPALRATIADIKHQRISEIWNLGDIVGYAPFPNETVELLRQAKVKSIVGNYDLKVLDFAKNRKEWEGKKDPAKFFSFAWADRTLSEAARSYLRKLPETLTGHWSGKKFLLVHGSPERNDEALSAETPPERLTQLLAGVKADGILCGHSHRFFTKEINNVWFINPGSVGRPFDQDVRASYATLEVKDGRILAQNRRIAYPVEDTVGKMRELAFPSSLIASIAEGKSLDDLNPPAEELNDALVIRKIQALAEACHYEGEHARQVTALALQLFDQLQELHGLGANERLWLQAAGLLHDIGWIEGQQSHHKTGRDRILKMDDFPLPREIQTVIALLVRYHRRNVPREGHRFYSDLSLELKAVVRKLAALLRIADGLDRSHGSFVQEILCQVQPSKVVFQVRAAEDCEWECRSAKEKADLFIDVFRQGVSFEQIRA